MNALGVAASTGPAVCLMNDDVYPITSDWLEGDYPARRLAYVAGMDELQARKGELMNIIQRLIQIESDK